MCSSDLAGEERIVNARSALREPRLSAACMLCAPGDQALLTRMLASKVPVALTTTPAPEVLRSEAALPAIDACDRAASFRAAPLVPSASGETGMLLSSVKLTLPPGKKPLPCRCSMLPGATLLLPVRESSVGLANTKPMPPATITAMAVMTRMTHLPVMPMTAFGAALCAFAPRCFCLCLC